MEESAGITSDTREEVIGEKQGDEPSRRQNPNSMPAPSSNPLALRKHRDNSHTTSKIRRVPTPSKAGWGCRGAYVPGVGTLDSLIPGAHISKRRGPRCKHTRTSHKTHCLPEHSEEAAVIHRSSRELPTEANSIRRAKGAVARTASPHFAVSTKWSFSTTVYSFAAGSAILYIVPSSCFPWMESTT